MADSLNRLSRSRFFCHRCITEFRGIPQEYLCPYCHTGFIEQLDSATVEINAMDSDYDDASMSNLEEMQRFNDVMGDEESFNLTTPPILNDVALLLAGGPLRTMEMEAVTGTTSEMETTGSGTTDSSNSSTAGTDPGNTGTQRRPTFMEELVWMIGGNRQPTGAMTAGAPFVLVGTPGDYVYGGEGLDAVVTQLLGQLEHSGPPPLPRERLAAIPTEQVSEEQAAANIACSVCWENFQLGETTSRLVCEHVFHKSCIEPWLQLHATCPICRRSLLPAGDARGASPPPAAAPGAAPAAAPAGGNAATAFTEARIRIGPRVIIRRTTLPRSSMMRRFPAQAPAGAAAAWPARGASPAANNSSSSLSSNTDLQYNTDIDYD